jgi:hypothetical protein
LFEIAVHWRHDLAPPAIADFDLPVARRSAVADYEVVCKPVLHPANVTMVVIKRTRIALPRAAIVHDNELPATALHRRTPDRFDH